MFAKIHGAEIYFDVDGPGLRPAATTMETCPTVFVLHGGPGGDHSSFKTQAVAQLRDVAQLVYIDHRGAGRSRSPDPETEDLEHNIEDLEGLRQYLGLPQVSLLGSSYGGMVAQGYAVRYPDRVANLILVATAPSYRFLADAQRIVAERGSAEQQRVCQWLWEGAFESDAQLRAYYRAMGPLYATTFDLEAFELGWDRGIRNFRQLNRGFGGFLRSFDFTAQLEKIQAPTLVLGGRHDWICPPNHSREIAERIPRAHLKLFNHSGHAIAQDEPAAFLAATRGFLTYA